MPFPRRLLVDDEEVIAELHPHWVVLARELSSFLAAVVVASAVEISISHVPSALGWILVAAVVVAGGWFATGLLRRRSITFVLTTSRIIDRRGVLGRRSSEVRLERVNEISSRQTIFGRMIGEGRLEVEVGGETGVVSFNHLPKPAVLQKLISEQISTRGWRGGAARNYETGRIHDSGHVHEPRHVHNSGQIEDPSSPTPPAGISKVGDPASARRPQAADDLVALDDLRRRGLLTEAEFQAKKAELLDRW